VRQEVVSRETSRQVRDASRIPSRAGYAPRVVTSRSLTVVVPLRDEAASVPTLAESLAAFHRNERERRVDYVFVDDGSRDGTHDLLVRHCAALPCRILRHDVNRGLSAALVTGSDAASGELIGWLDADLSYRPEVLHELAACADAGADIALASCHHPGGRIAGVPAWRRVLSRSASWLYRRATGHPVHTFTCMVRVYRREVLARCRPVDPGFPGVTEVLLCALRCGFTVREVPATLHRRRQGASKLRLLRATRLHLGLIWRAARGRA
jgi:dolichol-phosphate mannosyltransferase